MDPTLLITPGQARGLLIIYANVFIVEELQLPILWRLAMSKYFNMDDMPRWASPVGGYLVIALLVATVIAVLVQSFVTAQKDGREPPILQPRIPILGHPINMIRKGADYFHELDKRHHQSLFTLAIGKGRMYVVTSPEWAQAIHKAHKSLQFNTLVAQAMKDLFCMDKESMDIINHNLNGEDGTRSGIMIEVHDMLGSVLLPGPCLDELNTSILDNFLPDINKLATDGPQEIQLWAYLRQNFSVASTTAIWGPKNPFAVYRDLESTFWTFEANMLQLMMMPYPHIFARKAWKARQRLFDTFEEYMLNKSYDEPGTSQMIRKRAEINMGKFGFTPKMHAYGDVSFVFGAIVNTIPAAFWMVSFIFEDPELLASVRGEIERCITTSTSPTGEDKRTINVTALRTSCPLLMATMREVLRLAGSININRHVAKDITVTNSSTGEAYLLKKDSVVQIASNVIHQRDFWGPDAADFNPTRFAQQSSTTTNASTKVPDPAAPFRSTDGKVHSAAFRSFGGGNNICPGRFFAQTEILALTALIVAGFEIEGVDTPGWYVKPAFEAWKLCLGVLKPANDVRVKVRRRKGLDSAVWGLEM